MYFKRKFLCRITIWTCLIKRRRRRSNWKRNCKYVCLICISSLINVKLLNCSQFAQANITQLETTRNSQQTQIMNLTSQTRQMELTIQTLGQYISEVLDENIGVDLPEDVRHIIQQLEDISKHQMNNPIARFGKSYSDNSYLRKPLNILGNVESKKKLPTEEKYGKSMSISSGMGMGEFALKIIRDDNNNNNNSSAKSLEKKSSYFDNTYELLRQQRKNSSPDSNQKTINNPLNKY